MHNMRSQQICSNINAIYGGCCRLINIYHRAKTCGSLKVRGEENLQRRRIAARLNCQRRLNIHLHKLAKVFFFVLPGRKRVKIKEQPSKPASPKKRNQIEWNEMVWYGMVWNRSESNQMKCVEIKCRKKCSPTKRETPKRPSSIVEPRQQLSHNSAINSYSVWTSC